MPTYEYACNACGHEFEEFQSIKADPIRTCPRCGKRKVARKIGIGGAVIFRGGGFYETDYRSADYEQAKKADAVPAAGAGTGAAAGSSKEQAKASSDESGAKEVSEGAPSGATPESASKPAATDGAASASSASGGETSSGSSSGPDTSSSGTANERCGSASGAGGNRKNHAREGRGVGNVLQLGRAKASARTASQRASKPGATSASGSARSSTSRPSKKKKKKR
jgi:putative FmdB family regulatory protein